MTSHDRRKSVRVPVIRNIGEPVELDVFSGSKKTTVLGFILNLSVGGMRVVTLGPEAADLAIGAPFVMELNLPGFKSNHIEGKISSIQKGEKAKLHGSNDEWALGLAFTKIKNTDAAVINKMADEWSICEAKVQLRLPDVCFKECSCFGLCEKPVKLKK